MSLQLMKATAHPNDKPICVTGFVGQDKKYKLVYFDPNLCKFYFHPSSKEKKVIVWEALRELAKQNRTGGPSGILEYLLLAVSGVYIIVDSCDGFYTFDIAARRIHQQYTGLKYPAINFSEARSFPYYMDIFDPDFETWSTYALNTFFNDNTSTSFDFLQKTKLQPALFQ